MSVVVDLQKSTSWEPEISHLTSKLDLTLQ